MSGCLGEFRLDGEQLPLDGATDRFDVEQVGEVLSQCDVPPPGGAGGGQSPAWRLPVVIVCAVVGFCLVLLLILLLVFCVRRHRSRKRKGERVYIILTCAQEVMFSFAFVC